MLYDIHELLRYLQRLADCDTWYSGVLQRFLLIQLNGENYCFYAKVNIIIIKISMKITGNNNSIILNIFFLLTYCNFDFSVHL